MTTCMHEMQLFALSAVHTRSVLADESIRTHFATRLRRESLGADRAKKCATDRPAVSSTKRRSVHPDAHNDILPLTHRLSPLYGAGYSTFVTLESICRTPWGYSVLESSQRSAQEAMVLGARRSSAKGASAARRKPQIRNIIMLIRIHDRLP